MFNEFAPACPDARLRSYVDARVDFLTRRNPATTPWLYPMIGAFFAPVICAGVAYLAGRTTLEPQDVFALVFVSILSSCMGVIATAMHAAEYDSKFLRIRSVFTHILLWNPPYHCKRPSRGEVVSAAVRLGAHRLTRNSAVRLVDKHIDSTWLRVVLLNSFYPVCLDDSGYTWERLETELVALSSDDAHLAASLLYTTMTNDGRSARVHLDDLPETVAFVQRLNDTPGAIDVFRTLVADAAEVTPALLREFADVAVSVLARA